MRIGIDVNSIIDKPTGVGYYTENLVAALKRLDDDNEYFYYKPDVNHDLNVARRLLWENIILRKTAKKDSIDILHIPGFSPPAAGFRKVVTTVHDLIGKIFSDNMGAAARFYWSRWLPYAIKRSDFIIADSESTKSDIIRYTGFDPSRIKVIYLSAAAAFMPIKEDRTKISVRNKYDLPGRFLLSVGTIEPRKNILALLRAYRRLVAEDRIEHALVIVGKKGWGADVLEDYVRREGLEGSVRFLGFIDESDLAVVYNMADAMVYPSFYEGFGLPPLEAMACGTPVISSYNSSLPEIVGDAAILIDPTDDVSIVAAVRELLSSSGKAAIMKEKGLSRARLFSWDKTAAETLDIYKTVYAASVSKR